ncbi:MAG: DUF302 domain-containing protein [candidate division KSB1 bacterium]|jgi:uncharacterized protein (DUF302 family)|nr:DUF302 domain-containing protein [candidate division KSB1 bacterium]
MQRTILPLIAGIIIGMILTGVLIWNTMPKMMITIHESKLDFESTVQSVQDAALNNGWKVPKIYNIQKSLAAAGHTEMTRLKILSICQPDAAYSILSDDDSKMVSAIMPCRMAVYVTKDSTVHIASMNIGMMSKMFGGNIASTMKGVADAEAEMIADIIKE